MDNAFMIAGCGSGSGKTTVTCALISAFKKEGYEVRAFKCGPDFIDPMFHRAVLGVPSGNLDLWMAGGLNLGDKRTVPMSPSVTIVEGVMGLYDGLSPDSDENSSYEIACAYDLPIILTVDAHGMGRSALAVIRGFLDMDREKRICGVILNRISKGYCDRLAPVIEKELSVKVLGCLSKQEQMWESRHLGLVMPEEVSGLKDLVEKAAEELWETRGRFLCLPGSRRQKNRPPVPESEAVPDKRADVRIAIAKDEAFCFYYEENLALLTEAGAELVPFSPLYDEHLPENVSGLILYGGYPELHAKKLSENKTMREEIRQAIDAGMPVLAECGGFMYLHESLTCEDGSSYPMVGTIKGACRYTGHLVRFGYVALSEKNPVFLPAEENTVRGHEFHYFDSDDNGNACICKKPTPDKQWEAAHVTEDSWCGYAHIFYPSNPAFPAHFVSRCRKRSDAETS